MRNWSFDGKTVKTAKGAAIQWEDERFFTLEYKGRVFNGELVADQSEDRALQIKINHRVFEVKQKGNLDDLISQLGLDVPKVRKLSEMQAPMPGRVLDIAVAIGQEVQPGDELLSLEAMKMENVLKAEGSGIVKQILIEKQQVVDKGQILIEFE